MFTICLLLEENISDNWIYLNWIFFCWGLFDLLYTFWIDSNFWIDFIELWSPHRPSQSFQRSIGGRYSPFNHSSENLLRESLSFFRGWGFSTCPQELVELNDSRLLWLRKMTNEKKRKQNYRTEQNKEGWYHFVIAQQKYRKTQLDQTKNI